MTQHTQRGMTIIEWMIVIAIIAILAVLAAPNFSSFIVSNRIAGGLSDFADSVRRAKTEANAKLLTVTMCIREEKPDTIDPTKEIRKCNTTNTTSWGDGWFVFLDSNNDETLDNGEEIYEYDALGQQIRFTGDATSTNHIRKIEFNANGGILLTKFSGATLNTATEFAICDPQKTIARGITVTAAGQISTPYVISNANCGF